MCPHCQDHGKPIRISAPRDVHQTVVALEAAVAAGRLVEVGGTCQLAQIRPGAKWPSDIIDIAMKCPRCHQAFHLTAETFHGAGGQWSAT